MEGVLTTVLLCAGIVLITLGIHTSNIVLLAVGGFFVGVYNAMMHKK